jgi:hypothetical protein
LGRKPITKPYKVIDSGSMAGNITSSTTNVTNLDSITYIPQWSGTTPVGELFVDVRHNVGISPDGFNSDWVELDFGESIAVSGNTGAHTITVETKAFSEIRLRYVRSSGTGTMQATISGEVGGA